MDYLNPLFGKIAMLAIIGGIVVIRAPYGNQSGKVAVVANRRGPREALVLAAAWLGSTVLPLLWVFFPVFSFADYPLHAVQFVAGVAISSIGLWLFRRSHIDLGRNGSITLDLRDGHRVVKGGVYRSIRHPMYTSILLYATGQALVVPNWVAGLANILAFFLLFALRVTYEEQMMLDQFGEEYRVYMGETKCYVPLTQLQF